MENCPAGVVMERTVSVCLNRIGCEISKKNPAILFQGIAGLSVRGTDRVSENLQWEKGINDG
jgi:hypothetical protein